MTHHREAPLERFLGKVDLSLGAYGVLGLEIGEYSSREINEAIRRRMLQVDRHAQRDSMDADEVRLAIHVAGAQLVDPAIRHALMARFERGPLPGESDQRDIRADGAWLSSLVLQTVARSGGWNANAKQRLAAIAHVHGLQPREMAAALARMTPRSGVVGRESVVVGAVASDAEEARPEQRTLMVASVALLLVSIALAALLAMVLVHRLDGGADAMRAGSREGVAGSAGAERVDSTAVSERESVPVLREGEGRRLVEAMRAARAGVQDPEELARSIESIGEQVASVWTELEEGAIATLPLEFGESLGVLHAKDGELARRTLGRIAGEVGRGAEGIEDVDGYVRGAWEAGLLARLGGLGLAGGLEVERARIFGVLHKDGSGSPVRTFEAGVEVWLEHTRSDLLGVIRESEEEVEEWRMWVGALERIGGWDRGMKQETLLESIGELLRARPGPSEHNPTARAMETALGAVDFRTNEHGAQDRVLVWFDDTTIPSDALTLLTTGMLRQGAAPGMGLELVLGSGATPADRGVVRDGFARLFGLASSVQLDAFLVRWRATGEEIERRLVGTDAGDALRRAVVYATLNSSAALYWSGDAERAREVLAEADRAIETMEGESFVERGRIDARRFTSRSLEPDGVWAAEYLSLRNPEEHMNLLATLRARGGPEGPADAAVLADSALRGSHIARRRLAQEVLVAHADDPFVLHAVLVSMASNLARQPDVHEMLETITGEDLPELESESWSRIARARVATRLLEVIGSDRLGGVDAMQDRLLAQYSVIGVATGGVAQAASGAESEDVGLRVVPEAEGLVEQAWSIHDAWMQRARRIIGGSWSPVEYGVMRDRSRARGGLEAGVIERFVAAQTSMCETLGYLVAAERRERAPVVRQLLVEAQAARIRASHVFQQIETLERAMHGLWSIRMERVARGEES